MKSTPTAFSLPARILHWLMAVLVLAMLFIGVGMVASVSERHQWLIGLHKPLGIAILILVLLRLYVRWRYPAPPLPADLPTWQRMGAYLSHWVLYALMLAMPLVGWAMLSAGGYPITLGYGVQLPAIVPAGPALFSVLRYAHQYLAYLLFLTFLLHMGAALYHGLIRRDGVLRSMVRGKRIEE